MKRRDVEHCTEHLLCELEHLGVQRRDRSERHDLAPISESDERSIHSGAKSLCIKNQRTSGVLEF